MTALIILLFFPLPSSFQFLLYHWKKFMKTNLDKRDTFTIKNYPNTWNGPKWLILTSRNLHFYISIYLFKHKKQENALVCFRFLMQINPLMSGAHATIKTGMLKFGQILTDFAKFSLFFWIWQISSYYLGSNHTLESLEWRIHSTKNHKIIVAFHIYSDFQKLSLNDTAFLKDTSYVIVDKAKLNKILTTVNWTTASNRW